MNILKLKGKIMENGYTQNQFTEKLHFSDSGWRRKLKNNKIDIELSLKIKDILNLTTDEYLDIFFNDRLDLKSNKR